MDNEQMLLVNICRCYLDNLPFEMPENIDLKKFYLTAKNHNTVGICHCVFNNNKEKVPKDFQELFLDKFFDLIYIYEKQSRAYNEIKELFNENGIKLIPLKGIVLRELYPVKESRSMGDIDLLISDRDKKAAADIMKKLNYKLYSSSDNVDEYKRHEVTAELHTRLFDDYANNAFDNAFENAEFSGNIGRLNVSFHFAYLTAHMAHHLKYTGAGLRLVLDLALMLRKNSINLDYVFDIMESAGLLHFCKVILSVCSKWFGCGERYVEDTGTVEEYLLSDGIFGSMKSDSKNTISRLVQCGAFSNSSESKLKLKLRLAFPPYKALKNSPYIKFLNGRPYMLVFAWIYRFFYNVINRRGHISRSVKNINDDKTLVLAKEELKFFEEIGLQ